MPPSHPTQPEDEWDFVPRDDEVDTDEPTRPAAETAAMHVEQPSTPAGDAGRADVGLGEPGEGPEYHFADEEPEQAPAGEAGAEGESEPDLEEILESQHYDSEPED